MELYPQDLRERQYARVLFRRAYQTSGHPFPETLTTPEPQPRLGRLGRLWQRGLSLSDREMALATSAAERALITSRILPTSLMMSFSLMIVSLSSIGHGNGILISPDIAWGSAILLWLGVLYASQIPLPRLVLRTLIRKPLSAEEATALLEQAKTELDGAYLGLVRDVTTATVPTEAREDLRAAVRALGNALDILPEAEALPQDVTALRQEAITLRAEAVTETDRVVSDSLANRADAIERRASAAARSQLQARRSAALCAEIEAQIAALREEIGALRGTGVSVVNDVPLGNLADAAKRVARIASAAADARAELDAVAPQAGHLPSSASAATPMTVTERGRMAAEAELSSLIQRR